MMLAESSEQYVPVVCPKCRARMHALAVHVGRTVACPDCGTRCTVTAPTTATPTVAPPRPDEYSLRNDELNAESPSWTLVLCPKCHTRMHAHREHAGQRIRCPDCATITTVPEHREPARRHAPDLVVGEYDMGSSPPAVVISVSAPPLPAAIKHRVPVSSLPRHPLLSGIYTFPWRADVANRWCVLTLALAGSGCIVWLAFGSQLSPDNADLAGGGGLGAAVAVSGGAFGATAFFTSLWTWSFAAACGMAIVRESASGADEIVEWPTLDWRDWFYNLLFLLYIAALASVASIGAGWLTNALGAAPGISWAARVAAGFAAFPFLMLSALESGTALFPVSAPICRSLFRLPLAWLVFYFQTSVWLAILVTIAVLGLLWPYTVILLLAPAVAAYIFIYARLLGRLGWLIVERLEPQTESGADAAS